MEPLFQRAKNKIGCCQSARVVCVKFYHRRVHVAYGRARGGSYYNANNVLSTGTPGNYGDNGCQMNLCWTAFDNHNTVVDTNQAESTIFIPPDFFTDYRQVDKGPVSLVCLHGLAPMMAGRTFSGEGRNQSMGTTLGSQGKGRSEQNPEKRELKKAVVAGRKK